jgi:hypothetical protein
MGKPSYLWLVLGLCLLPSGGQAKPESLARIDCEARDNGAPASASFVVLGSAGEIAKARCGQPTSLPAGSYEVAVHLDGAADAPVSRQRVEAGAGQLTKVLAEFETGELLVEITREGRRSVGQIKLLQHGRQLAILSSGVATRVSAGTYTLEVSSRGRTRALEAVTVSRGERRVLSAELARDDGH